MTNGHKAAWQRLQRISCIHALALMPKKFGRPRSIGVPQVIADNVAILGRGTEEEVKARNLWYLTFHPAIFKQSCTKIEGSIQI